MPTYYVAGYPISDELYHHGIKGQRWGVRRYQNEDGSLTAAGKARYGSVENFKNSQDYKTAKKQYKKTKSDSDYRKMLKAFNKYNKTNEAESIKRGNKLLAMGRSKEGAIGRGIGREVAIIAAKKVAGAAIGAAIGAAVLKTSVDMGDPETVATVMKGSAAVGAILTGAAIDATVKNVSKTARQYKDIKRAEEKRR